MATSISFYKNIIPLEKTKHKDLTLTLQDTYAFAEDANSVPLAGYEFFMASRNYPVMFTQTEQGEFTPVAILSLKKKGHDMGPRWEGAYVPGFLRRYPFLLSNDGSILFDSDAPHFGGDGSKGERLLTDEGEASDTLKKVVDFLQFMEASYKATIDYVKALQAKALLEPFKGQVKIAGQAVNLDGLYVISEKKLYALDKDEVYEWFKAGWIAWSHAHLHSVNSMEEIVKRAQSVHVGQS